jgi:hypothetical protein
LVVDPEQRPYPKRASLHQFPWPNRALREYPRMPATVIAERVGWQRSITVLRDRVRELRPVYLPPDPASRTTYGRKRVQCDLWFPPVDIPLGAWTGGPSAGGDGQRVLAGCCSR